MDPITIGLLISALAPVVGNIAGGIASQGDNAEADKLSKEALAKIMGVSLPDVDDLKLEDLQKYASVGQLTPEMEQAILQKESEMKGISTDPRLREAQMTALSKLTQVGQEGLNAEDRLALNTTRREVSRDAQGRNEAILQKMGERGMAGSGAELAAQLANSQAATERQSQEGDRTAALATQRALQAVMQSGQLGGEIRGQDFDQAAAIAKAQDAINQFNSANSQGVQTRNISAKNSAQATNLSNDQRIADSNVSQVNTQQEYNKRLLAEDYQRRLAKAQTEAGAQQKQADVYRQKAEKTAKSISQIGSGIGKAAGPVAGVIGGGAGVADAKMVDDSLYASAPDSYKQKKLKGLYEE